MIDILLVNSNSSLQIYQNLNKISQLEPPIWASLIAKNLSLKGYRVNILDAEADRLTIKEIGIKINEINPKLVCFVVYGQQPSASTQNMTGVSLCLKELNYSHKTLLIGPHPSALPKQTMEDEFCDFVCQGEGPYTIDGLLQSDMNNISHLKKIPGLWYRDKDEICSNPPASLIPQGSLEKVLPGMSWDLLDMKKYRTANWHSMTNDNITQPFASIYTSLGCPYKCSFCCINAPFEKHTLRYWEPEHIIEQLDYFHSIGIKNLKIADEMFVLNKNHFMKLCELIIDRGYDFNIWAYARVDTVKEKYLETLKKAGVNWLALGIESGNRKVRQEVTKGKFTELDIKDIVRKIQSFDISVVGNFIFGLPEDDFDTMEETYQLAKELKCEWTSFYSSMAYPGSQLHNMIDENDLPKTYTGYSQHSYDCKPTPTQYLSSADVLKFRDEAFHRLYTDKEYVDFLRERFGQGTIDELNKILKHKLKRKLIDG